MRAESNLLRAAGSQFTSADLHAFDGLIETTLGDIVGGDLSDTALFQASLGTSESGLGLRGASDLAIPAFVATRALNRPLVEHLASAFQDVLPPDLMDSFDSETTQAERLLYDGLSAAGTSKAVDILNEGRTASTLQQDELCSSPIARTHSPVGRSQALRKTSWMSPCRWRKL